MSLLDKLIRKFFLVKEIVSKYGHVHFRRYRLLQTPWFAIYIHQICKSDEDSEMHDHPFSFQSLILEGAYQEACRYYPAFDKIDYDTYYTGDVIKHCGEDAHKITLLSQEVWTLVFASKRYRVWGYRYADGRWVDFKTYRKFKNDLREDM